LWWRRLLRRLFLFLLWLVLLLLRLRLRPRRCLGLRPRLGLRLRPWCHLRLGPRLRLRLRLRCHLGLRVRLRLLDLRLGPRLHLRLDLRRCLGFYLGLDLRLDPSWCLRLDLRRCLRLPLGLAGGAAMLQPLVFYFLLPPLLRRQALVALGQGHAAGLGGPGSSRRGCGRRGVGAGGASPRVEFSRFSLTGRRDPGLHLSRLGRSPRLHLPGFGVSPRLDWARLTGHDGRSRFDRGAKLARFRRGAGVPRSRLSHRGFKGLRLRRLEPLLRGQLLNLLGHVGGQGHGGPAG
jgi:hypothetical protein